MGPSAMVAASTSSSMSVFAVLVPSRRVGGIIPRPITWVPSSMRLVAGRTDRFALASTLVIVPTSASTFVIGVITISVILGIRMGHAAGSRGIRLWGPSGGVNPSFIFFVKHVDVALQASWVGGKEGAKLFFDIGAILTRVLGNEFVRASRR